jgi:hypothetical protein
MASANRADDGRAQQVGGQDAVQADRDVPDQSVGDLTHGPLVARPQDPPLAHVRPVPQQAVQVVGEVVADLGGAGREVVAVTGRHGRPHPLGGAPTRLHPVLGHRAGPRCSGASTRSTSVRTGPSVHSSASHNSENASLRTVRHNSDRSVTLPRTHPAVRPDAPNSRPRPSLIHSVTENRIRWRPPTHVC